MTKSTNKPTGSDSSKQVQKNEHLLNTTKRNKKLVPTALGVALLTATIYSGVSVNIAKQKQVSNLTVQVEKQDEQIKKLNLTLKKQQDDYTKALEKSNTELEKTKQEAKQEKQKVKKVKKVTKQYKTKYKTLKQKHQATKKQLDTTKKQNKVLKEKVAMKQRAITLASNPVAHATHKNTSSSSTNSSKTITVTATAYTAHCGSCSGITATGVNVRHSTPNLIAVDPRVVPLGKHVELIANGKSLGTYLAGDTGGAIKGNKIDILVSSDAEAIKWGVRTVTLKVLD